MLHKKADNKIASKLQGAVVSVGSAVTLTMGIKGNGLELPVKGNKWPIKK